MAQRDNMPSSDDKASTSIGKTYRKTLSPTELQNNFIVVKGCKEMFPEPNTTFSVHIEGRSYSARVDAYDRLRKDSGFFVDLDAVFRVGDSVVLTKIAEGNYTITKDNRSKTKQRIQNLFRHGYPR